MSAVLFFLRRSLYLGLSLVLLWLSGCAARAPLPDASLANAWHDHRAALVELRQWQAQGRIAVNSNDEGWSAHFDWLQRGPDYRIRLRGPFGQGGVELNGNDEGVWLKRADQSTAFAGDPERLLASETGWRLPVAGLFSWLRGLPLEHEAQTLQWDEKGRLQLLEQKGWRIAYRRYRDVESYALPALIRLRRDDVSVKFVIDEWLPM